MMVKRILYIIFIICYVRFLVLTAVSMKFRVFWDVLPCSQIDVGQRFTHHPNDGGSTHL
jgi:hypothetical protein